MEHTVLTVFLHFEWSDKLALGVKNEMIKGKLGAEL